MKKMKDPKTENLQDPLFLAIWHEMNQWENLYEAGLTLQHAQAMFEALSSWRLGIGEALRLKGQQELKSGQAPLPNGCTLYWKTNELGQRIYSSDEIGGGVHVWDVTVVDQSTLLAGMAKESELQAIERWQKEKECK